MHPYVNIAVKAARKAGELIARAQIDLNKLTIEEKAPNDFVSNIDQKAEFIIRDVIQQAYPTHSILGEEQGFTENEESNTVWIIDPIDGTQNFIKGLPFFAVSIGIKEDGKLTHGVIYDPMRQELFTATRGKGAFLNSRIRVSDKRGLNSALVATGFPHYNKENWSQYQTSLQTIFSQVADIRYLGSAALALAYVACGRLDGYWESGLKEWDIAAGALLVKEAGGFVTDFSGQENYLQSGDVVAGPIKLLKELLPLVG
jgi:myo-inositol-1(or 4)-monophosphatase